jgi:GWxTD domain-containing protein
MRRRNFVILFVLALTLSNFAQNPADKPINAKREITAEQVYKKFPLEDVPYIITKDELIVWRQLKTNEERENFIENFWRRRDPDPDTEANEFREEYYERIAYANEKFTSGIPGWRTDRGRIYIMHGKPDSIESHPSGGSYDRPSYEGGGTTTTYPFEIWFYRNIDGVGSGTEIEFVDPTGTGEYRIARDANEKDALKYVPGAGQTLAEQLGLETRADRLSGLNRNYGREQDSEFNRIIKIKDLMTPPRVNGVISPIENIHGPLIGDGIDFEMRVDFFRYTDDKVAVSFTVQTDNKELSFKDVGGIQTARMNIFGKVTQVSGRNLGTFQEVVSTTTTAQELADTANRSSVFQQTVPLSPGTYKTEILIRDTESGKAGIKKIGFTVPKYEADKLATSTLILASRLTPKTEKDIGTRFVIGDKKVIPNLSATYKRGQEVGVYLQVYNAGIDQTTLRPAVDVEYVLTKDGKEVIRENEDWKGLSDAGQRLVLARFIQTENLAVGEYELKIRIQDRVNNQKLESTEKFKISE